MIQKNNTARLIVGLLFVIGFLSPKITYGHVLETDQAAIGAVLHIEPNDDPFAGTNTSLIFEVTDKSGAFDPAQCHCTVQIVQNDQIITSARIEGYDVSDAAKTLYATVVFPDVGTYSVQLLGKPVTRDWFDEFELLYEVRVVRQVPAEVAEAEGDASGLGVVLVVVGFALLVGAGVWAWKRAKLSIHIPTYSMSEKTERNGQKALADYHRGKTTRIINLEKYFNEL